MLRAGPKFAKASAIIGAITWAMVVLIRTSPSAEINLINKILLLGILVITPLGFSLVATPDRHGRHSFPYRVAALAQPFGALAGLGCFFLEPGLPAAMLASIWFVVTGSIAGFGLWRFLPRGFHPAEEIGIDAGLFYLPIGGFWFIMSRLGTQPLGFGDTIVLLTAVHFHFAGFVAPLLAGLAGRLIGRRGFARKLFRVTVACIIIGIPLVAAGITASPLLALIGAAIISSGLVLLAVTVFGWVLSALRSLPARILLFVSSISGVLAMSLASIYAYSIVAKKLIVDIPQMAMTHGMANAFGFALCGLVAWSIVKPISRAARPGIPFSKLSAGKFAGSNYFQRVGAVSQSKPPAMGLVDDFSIYGRADFDPALVDAAVRSFYENTVRFRLIVRPSWRLGFRLGGRIANSIGTRLGQLRLPVSAERLEDRIESKLFPLDDSMDGRTGVRAWVRTYEGTDKAMYVAAYATHTQSGNTYMNIAFPLLGGNLSSILHVASISEPRGSISLSTLPIAHAGGDQGVYFANRISPVRLPMNEVITVWAVNKVKDSENEATQPTIKATHEIWLCGIKFLELAYDIFPDGADK
jgi:hypothetical protein